MNNSGAHKIWFLPVVLLWIAAAMAHGQKMILVPAGDFEMGSPASEPDRFEDERLHKVVLSKAFYLGEAEVPWSLWNRVRDWAIAHGYHELSKGNNGFNGPADEDHPVIAVTWWDAIQWCNARSEMEGLKPVYYKSRKFNTTQVIRNGIPEIHVNAKATGYRLPTEAEWEYACRAGSRSAYANDSRDENGLTEAGWHAMNSQRNTHPAGKKPPNAFGLYDMHGNAWEWCWDWYGPYPDKEARDPTGPDEGSIRILRGGSWMNAADHARSAYRHALAPSTLFYTNGFRVARNR